MYDFIFDKNLNCLSVWFGGTLIERKSIDKANLLNEVKLMICKNNITKYNQAIRIV